MVKIFLGILIGMLLALGFYYTYNLGKQKREDAYQMDLSKILTVLKKEKALPSQVLENNLNEAVNVERINTLQTRFNDLYVLGGMIVTILLAINIGVYFKTEHEVSKHMSDNFKTYKEQVEEYVTDAETLLGKIQGHAKVAEQAANTEKQRVQSVNENQK